jgi:hypothetical protein
VAGLVDEVVVHPSHVCQIGGSDQDPIAALFQMIWHGYLGHQSSIPVCLLMMSVDLKRLFNQAMSEHHPISTKRF